MPLLSLRSLLPILILLSTSPAALAARTDAFVPDQEAPVPSSVTPGAPWSETATTLPPWPRDADLAEFVPDGPATGLRYFIDTANLRVGADQVVRFTLVAESRGGARNVSHEGLRCTPRGAYRIYAYGLDGRFAPATGPDDWQPLSGEARDAWRQSLWAFHFCIPRVFAPRPAKDMIRSLRGHLPERQNWGFQTD